jgi:hypothetical protein
MPLIRSISLPIQILRRQITGKNRDWTTAEMGPGKFIFVDNEEVGVRVHNFNDDTLLELVKEIQDIHSLVMLNLSENRKITDKGLRVLKSLIQIEELNLSACDITNKGLEFLASFPHLRILNISYCNRITGEGLLFLKKSSKLDFLDVQGLPKINTGHIARIRRPTLIIHRH